jgi:formamidopyrimidine-DNA glycosylase
VPEADSVWKAARRLRGQLVGRTVTGSDFRVPQHATADLSGREVTAFESYGKHLLTRFTGGLTLHTHLREDRPCRRCGTPVAFRDSATGTADSAVGVGRETWWCPHCQPGPFPSLAERPTRPGLRRGVNEESFGSRTRRLRGGTGLARR